MASLKKTDFFGMESAIYGGCGLMLSVQIAVLRFKMTVFRREPRMERIAGRFSFLADPAGREDASNPINHDRAAVENDR
jgi:hypothetical protein